MTINFLCILVLWILQTLVIILIWFIISFSTITNSTISTFLLTMDHERRIQPSLDTSVPVSVTMSLLAVRLLPDLGGRQSTDVLVFSVDNWLDEVRRRSRGVEVDPASAFLGANRWCSVCHVTIKHTLNDVQQKWVSFKLQLQM